MKEEGGRQKVEEIPLAEWVVPRVEKAMPADFPDEPYLGLDDIEAHTTRLLGSKSAADMKSSAKRFFPGDVLYSRLRPYLNKVWLADRSGLCSAEFIVLPSNDFIDGAFLKYRLNARDFVSFANSLNAGDRPRVDFDQISAFCLPPFALARQRRIVLKIEELFSELDAGEAALKKARHQLGVYRQSLLKQAFAGNLTAPWRAQHPDLLESADQLLARIQAEREARYEKQLKQWERVVMSCEKAGSDGRKPPKPRKPKPVPSFDRDEVERQTTLPQGWAWSRISAVAGVGTGVTPLRSNADFHDDGNIPWITSTVVNYDIVRKPNSYVTKHALEKTKLQLFPAGSLIVALYGEGKTRGKVSQIAFDSTTNQALAVLVQHGAEQDTRAYLKLFLLKNYQDVRRLSSGGVQPNLNLGLIERMPVPLCSLPEQQEIVRLLDEQFEVIEQNEQEIDAALKRSEALRQSILKKAFTGQLVPQDPTDEPAHAVLERIREIRGSIHRKFHK